MVRVISGPRHPPKHGMDFLFPSHHLSAQHHLIIPVRALTAPSKVDLALCHLDKVPAPLDEGIELGEYAGFVQDPALLRESVVDTTCVLVGLLPLLAAGHALLGEREREGGWVGGRERVESK